MLFTIVEITDSYVYFPMAVFDNPVYCLLIVHSDIPVSGKIISDTIWNNSNGNVLFVFGIGKHDTVDGIVQCTVTSHYDNGGISIVGKNSGKPFYRAETFGLHIVVCHTLLVHVLFYFLPSFLHFPCPGFGVIDHPPFSSFYAHCSYMLFSDHLSLLAVFMQNRLITSDSFLTSPFMLSLLRDYSYYLSDAKDTKSLRVSALRKLSFLLSIALRLPN